MVGFAGSTARPRLVEPQLQASSGLKSAPVRPELTPNQVVPPSMLLNTPRELSTAYIVLGLLGSNASPSIREPFGIPELAATQLTPASVLFHIPAPRVPP